MSTAQREAHNDTYNGPARAGNRVRTIKARIPRRCQSLNGARTPGISRRFPAGALHNNLWRTTPILSFKTRGFRMSLIWCDRRWQRRRALWSVTGTSSRPRSPGNDDERGLRSEARERHARGTAAAQLLKHAGLAQKKTHGARRHQPHVRTCTPYDDERKALAPTLAPTRLGAPC